jgi:hypothetical protein
MKKHALLTAIAVLACHGATPALAAGPNDPTTMQGWQRIAEPAAMAYVRVPFHATRKDRRQARAGIMITSPRTYRAGQVFTRTSAPGMVDFGFTGTSFSSPWTATLNVSTSVAWAQDPEVLPKNTHYLSDSGLSWVVVGVISAGIIGGVYALSDRPKEE